MNATNDRLGRPPESIAGASEGVHFWKNLAIIRPVAWIIAILFFAGMQSLFWLVIFPNGDPHETAKMPLELKIFLPTLASSIFFIWALLVGFVYADAKRRAMRYVMWTLLAAFVPNAIGIILYFLMRDPLPSPCPKCGLLVKGSFSFCPRCGTELMRACRVCKKKLEPGWVNCAYCGAPTAQPTRAA
ncbi:MAG TPA: zinc ribbon domain-containing protein [Candidatus Acidoferrales bacterium]|nr:zinc ribbon domain-containing protein [Candidatus Acidoferrales bacterium]